MKNITYKYLAQNLKDGKLNIVYPEINSEQGATILSNTIKGAIAVIRFKQDEKIIYGVLCNFFEQFENQIEK